MSHYEIKYDQVDEQAKRDKAIADCADWLGIKPAQFKTVFTLGVLAGWAERDEQLCLAYSFAGIQGYPVSACFAYAQELLGKDKPKA